MQVQAWTVHACGEPMRKEVREETPGEGEVVVGVAGCGVCHTDLGFFYDGVPTRHPFPLTLGHEIAGRVVEAGPGAEEWMNADVVVPAVMPCGQCAACKAGQGSICPKQIFPGNDVHGGFASHVRVPAHGLCRVPDLTGKPVDLPTLSVMADAVTTAYQAILRSGLGEGDLAVFVGAGGVGGFGIQIAAALGATAVAIDVDEGRLEMMREHGATLALKSDDLEFKELRGQIRALAKERDVPTWRRKIFETSGVAAGQLTAFGLLEHGGYLSMVGFTPEKVKVRLSNLMAFDARVEGNWGCLPEHYPAVLDLILTDKVKLGPFAEHRPLDTINEVFEGLKAHEIHKRVVLIPES